jgi:hypothetical protein
MMVTCSAIKELKTQIRLLIYQLQRKLSKPVSIIPAIFISRTIPEGSIAQSGLQKTLKPHPEYLPD